VAEIIEPSQGREAVVRTYKNKCEQAFDSYLKLGLSYLKLPLISIGLYNTIDGPRVLYTGSENSVLLTSMQFIIEFSLDRTIEVYMQRMYLQQVITKFYGGHYTPTRGFHYLLKTNKSTGIQIHISSLSQFEKAVDALIKEANRFMYMYCRTDI
jgi:hypothetical protein